MIEPGTLNFLWSQAIVAGFDMNIRRALAQGLFEKVIHLFNDAG